MSRFGKFQEEFGSKEKFYKLLLVKKNSDKEFEHVIRVWERMKEKD